MKKKKRYVIRIGRQTGVVDSRDICKQRIDNFPGARYQSYENEQEAHESYTSGPRKKDKKFVHHPDIILPSVCVDASCRGNPGMLEYQCVWTSTGKKIFHHGPWLGGTNNIGEFLAIIDAMKRMENTRQFFPIYSDSQIALGRIKKKYAKTTATHLPPDLYDRIHSAHNWLAGSDKPFQCFKRKTNERGEIPADFGRK